MSKMKIGGIIAEYNPFHNGHEYQIEEFKSKYGISHLIVAMSGNFIQRGGPAVIDKYSRCDMALSGGVDLVIEIPAYFCTQTAEIFARGGIVLFDSLNCVEELCFGSENDDIKLMKKSAQILYENNAKFKESLSNYLKMGDSFPIAREKSLREYIEKNTDYKVDDNFYKKSNNILGIEYLKELIRLESNINPVTIRRIGNSYNSINTSGYFSSATSIRKLIEKENFCEIRDFVPNYSYEILEKYKKFGCLFLDEQDFFENICIEVLRNSNKLNTYFDIKNGLENSILKKTLSSEDICDLIDELSSPTYTRNKIRRSLFNILLGVKNSDLNKIKNIKYMPYMRVLGFNKRGIEILGEIKKNSNVDIVTSIAKSLKLEKYNVCDIYKIMMDFDLFSSELYYQKMCSRNRSLLKKGKFDFITLITKI